LTGGEFCDSLTKREFDETGVELIWAHINSNIVARVRSQTSLIAAVTGILLLTGPVVYAQEGGAGGQPVPAEQTAASPAQTGTQPAASELPAGGAASGEAAIFLDAPPPPNPRAAEADMVLGAQEPGAGIGGPSIFSVVQILFTLGLIAAAVYGVVYFIKRSKKSMLSENPHLKVLASIPINARTQAAVIALGNKAYLVGTGESSVTLIAEHTDKETLDAMMLDYAQQSAQTAPRISFKALLQTLAGRGAADGGGTPPPRDLTKQRERLRGL
jgi:flagellar protein FliO/FliZ